MKLQTDDLGVVGVTVADWDITKSFKPKTITTDYSSWISYISRKAVPANTPITDVRYWKPITRLQTNLALDNKFGNGNYVGVNQKVLTNAFNKLWQKIEDMTGEALQGIRMTVNPEYFIGDTCTVNISANTVEANGVFEKIEFYKNDDTEPFVSAENVDTFTTTTTITSTTVIKCKATIMGIEYTRQSIITKHDRFFMLSGTFATLQDAVDYAETHPDDCQVDLDNDMRGAYDITCADGDYIYVIVGTSLREGLLRADMGGIEIPFDNDTTVGNYTVLKSTNAYNEGTYNVDING